MSIFTFEQSMRLTALQSRIWRALEEALREDGHRKSSDGIIELSFCMPPAFDHSPPTWMLTIHSYVLCEMGRRESFSAPTIEGVLAMAEAYAAKICMGFEFRALDREFSDPNDDDMSTDDVEFAKPTGRPDDGEMPF